MSSLANEFPKVIIDPKAETAEELFRQWPRSRRRLGEFITERVRAGEWEPVYKRVGKRLVQAYRRAHEKQ